MNFVPAIWALTARSKPSFGFGGSIGLFLSVGVFSTFLGCDYLSASFLALELSMGSPDETEDDMDLYLPYFSGVGEIKVRS